MTHHFLKFLVSACVWLRMAYELEVVDKHHLRDARSAFKLFKPDRRTLALNEVRKPLEPMCCIGEFVDMINKGQWIVLPCSVVQHLPGLPVSPLGVVPQRKKVALAGFVIIACET